MSKNLFIIFIMAIVFVTGASASNVIIFDNQSAHPGGTLTFGTSSGAASLANGVIDEVTGIDGVVTSFSVAGTCGAGSFGCLNFTTGLFLGSSTTGDTTTYEYAAGGSLTITGTADGGSGTLYSNAGFAAPVTLNYNTATGLSSLSGSLAAGMLNAALASSLGVQPNTLGGTDTSSTFNIVFSGGNGTGSATTNSVQVAAAAAAPEPASMLLLGAGFITLGSIRRKQIRENKSQIAISKGVVNEAGS